ncbi:MULTISPECIES: class I SAM-dependent methyltransferase [unclassified Pseudofrankia]|uniref:class I SAM-dependent DNA methyltransferase n=1 Tax=unclassified Pseudofrankia TaxID=2994372 RepID=UPI0008D95F4C|nr:MULTISPECIES: class I SAM-dependent methyltransferase [unclassified Pseudofrankia]MDT3445086.1 class I SAM-dependent methyltransferase [Pseudofrankia sp. BMG5.37]OHV47368.1 methyltransferase [Pseudofrankia sp. BMG5.36]
MDRSSRTSSDYGPLCSLVYQLDKPVGTSSGDVEFYRDLLAGTSGEILEPAVGTGRILIPLLQAGFRVRGFDPSPAMLTICRDNCAAHGLDPVLFEADLVTFQEPAAFAAVVIPTGSFALVTGRERAAQALRNLRESLRPGGRLIVDVEPLEQSTSPGPLRHWWLGDEMLTLSSLPPAQPEEGVVSSWLRYERWRDGRLVETELQNFSLQRYDLDGFAALLREAGFTAVTVHADYQAGLSPTPDSHVWTFVATA